MIMTPVFEERSFLLKDSPLPKMRFNDEDNFSTDSWDSNDDMEELKLPNLSKQTEDFKSYIESNVSQQLSPSPVGKYSKKIILADDTPEMVEVKRERNRLAARKCRQKQKDRIGILEQDVREISKMNYQVETEIRSLQIQLEELKHILVNHDCVMRAPVLARNKYLMNF